MSIFVFFGAGFALHLIWELAQMPFFAVSGLSALEIFTMCLYATATGDMIFMATLYLLLATVHRRIAWSELPATYRHPATWIIPVVVGALLATSYELWAIHAVERWQYKSTMPILPVIRVGLFPVLQMIVIPLLVLMLCWARAVHIKAGPSTPT